MAETRKHRPKTSAIGDAVREALGESLVPAYQVGKLSDEDHDQTDADFFDPFVPEEHQQPDSQLITAAWSFPDQTGPVVSITVDQVDQLTMKPREDVGDDIEPDGWIDWGARL